MFLETAKPFIRCDTIFDTTKKEENGHHGGLLKPSNKSKA
jgi:hypothetical protein